jgi:DNA polymerase-3 subunit gamma/tau
LASEFVSYTVLAVKWRPRQFADLVGQAHVVTALVNSLESERLHHAYLFSGTRGVGKTTIARLLAKALNCERGISADPCGECGACQAIDEGRFVDLIEVDAASRTRVDDTRELLDNVQYMPTRGRFKVYLIDEVHMLSTHSFNALLKTLEEPPPHVKFLLATTDPQKLPVTVLSRCLQFNLKKLPRNQIQAQLGMICEAEGVPAEDDALQALAKAADGSMRDGLSLLDQSIAFGGGEITASQTAQMLGTIDRQHITKILQALATSDGATIIETVAELEEQAADFGAALDDLMASLQRMAVQQLVEGSVDDDPEIEKLAREISPEDTQLYYQIAVHGSRDLAFCRDERMSFEMTLLRMLAFRPDAADGAETAESKPRRRQQAGTRGGEAAPARRERTGHAATRSAEQAKAQRTQPPARKSAQATAEQSDWPALVQAAALRGAVRNLADHCELGDNCGPGQIELVLADDKSNFNTVQLRQRLQDALSDHLGRPVRLTIREGQPPRPTPAEIRRAGEDEQMRRAREAMESDPNILAVQAAFGAVLEPDSIQPPATKEH